MADGALCQACEGFDVRALYELASERIRKTKPKKYSSISVGFSRYEGFPDFYRQHSNLQALCSAAESGCQLCASIWQQYAKQLPPELENSTQELYPDEYGEPVYLGLSDWTPEADGMPYLIAAQRLPRGAVRNLATFEVYVKPQAGPSGFEHLLSRTVQPNPASEASLQVAQSWHSDCLNEHPKCARLLSQTPPLPTRLIDVGNAATNPKLTITNGMMGTWAALSYCWGGNSPFVLNKETSNRLFGGHVPLAEYPQTLQDAIIVTRALNLRYLWIDALCIVQDSPEDWAAEAARMRDVYGGATITIAATNSKSTNCENHTVFLRSSSDFWDTTLKSEPLNTRGWTLQESLLAPRTLSYGTQQMVWECQSLKTSESGRPVLPGESHRDKAFVQTIIANDFNAWEKTKQVLTRLSLNSLSVNWTAVPEQWENGYDAMYSRWFAIVKDFTGRNLTVQSDILPTLSGVAAAFQNLLRDQYFAGLWRNDIVRGLCWSRSGLPKREVKAGPKREDAHLPSWSWASVVGGRVVNTLGEEQMWPFLKVEETARLVDAGVTPKFADVFGQITDAHLTIKAPFCYIDNPRASTTDGQPAECAVLNERVRGELQIRTSAEEFEQQHQAHPGQRFALIRLMKTSRTWTSTVGTKEDQYLPGASIMMLESIGAEGPSEGSAKSQRRGLRKGKREGTWRRVGFFSLSVPAYADDDDMNVRFLNEMKRLKWKWREVDIV